MQSISSSSQHTCLLQVSPDGLQMLLKRQRPQFKHIHAACRRGQHLLAVEPRHFHAAAVWQHKQTQVGSQKFQTGCHAGGGNIVQAGASLQTSDLQKNGAATTDAIYKLVYYGKGKMPGYGKECTPRGKCTFGPRLPDEDVQRLSQYVLDQAAAKWK